MTERNSTTPEAKALSVLTYLKPVAETLPKWAWAVLVIIATTLVLLIKLGVL